MNIDKYLQDQFYRTAARKDIGNARPEPSEGNDGDEKWVSIGGKVYIIVRSMLVSGDLTNTVRI